MAYIYYVSVGSNLGNREAYLDGAVAGLKRHPAITAVTPSAWIETAPWGNTDQGPFLNGVIRVETTLAPEDFFVHLKTLENEAGRTREIHWGPRSLDLDIVWAEIIDSQSGTADRAVHASNTGAHVPVYYKSETLEIPHPYMWERSFVLIPLAELYPGFERNGLNIIERISQLSDSN